jgi:signal transduction histidine kinase
MRLSLRAHIFSGAVLWSLGLFLLSSLALVTVTRIHPRAPAVVHGWLGHATIVLAISITLLALGLLQVRSGFSAVKRLRDRLAALHAGDVARLDGWYPAEIQPLVDDLNVLLDARDRAIARAVERAGDLAHGLKTPLAVLATEADRVRAAGEEGVAESISRQVGRMKRHVDYHLAQARAALPGTAAAVRSSISESVEGLIRAIERLHADRGLHVTSEVAPSCTVRVRRPDLDEMIGNVLDNACRWARSRVTVSAAIAPDRVTVSVDDDGAGMDPALYEAALRRGVRADEAGDGSGLGLAIVKDLIELYGGSVVLGRSPLGGLRVEMRLPSGVHARRQ